jgi:phosphoglycolate phosphatase
MTAKHEVKAVLFDLDGTLIDSAHDLVGSANALRVQRGLEPMPFETLRLMVGAGARGMVGEAFGVAPGDADFEELRDAYLAIYAQRLLERTDMFDDVKPVLQALESWPLAWGIVTNKAGRFTMRIVEGLGLHTRAAVVIAGDTTPHSKPHPEPLLEAARRMALTPEHCVYVGDDLRDVQAGRAAGMTTLVAAWGYLGKGEPIEQWGADVILERPADLLKWLRDP